MSGIPKTISLADSLLSRRKESPERDARFTDLVHRRSLFVFRVAYAALRNKSDAEEVVQETFLKLYRSDAIERMQDERAFLARTAWRLAIDRRSKTVIVMPSEDLAASGPSPEDAAIAEDWNTAIHRLIDALPDHLRLPLALSTVNEMTSREIAQAMGIAEGTVRTRLMRARQILKEKLETLKGGSAP
ncbi:MAG TPA: sigma-70 family RNA polymerase sigma factor [Terriglobia bacterium]|nr:sigma-70 family RNA polymerase sigma factor [Terriglobia bacterium]